MTPQHNDPPPTLCAICGERPAQSVVAGRDGEQTVRIPTCGECFCTNTHPELRLFRQSLRLIIGGWPR